MTPWPTHPARFSIGNRYGLFLPLPPDGKAMPGCEHRPVNYLDTISVRATFLCLIIFSWRPNLLHHSFFIWTIVMVKTISTYIKIIKRLGVVSIFLVLKLNLARRVVKDDFLSGCLFIWISVYYLFHLLICFLDEQILVCIDPVSIFRRLSNMTK
jgi:hypothetical protein